MADECSVINDPRRAPEERLAALQRWNARSPAGVKPGGEINNHIHTVYSFSPYTPSMAALKAREAGLSAAGSVDHDSAAAASEMIAACAELGMGGCSGFEIRVRFQRSGSGKSPFAGRKINNPDSKGSAYITVQGIPSPALEKTAAFLKPVREARFLRNKKMTEAANALLQDGGLTPLDFEQDVAGTSQWERGGEITERHLMAACAVKLAGHYGRGEGIISGLYRSFGIKPGAKLEKLLSDPENPHYLYDLLGVLKTDLLPRFFIQPGEEECIPAEEAAAFAHSINAVPAYAYLGDVGESPTGDKKAEQFEDEFLPELFEELKALGFRAVTYMPPRNTREQILRIQRFCREGGFMEISGVDINSSRQSFNCPEVLEENCRHLVDTTWALIAHERLASEDPAFGLFSSANPLASLPPGERIAVYAEAGKALNAKRPEESAPGIIEELRKGRKTWNR